MRTRTISSLMIVWLCATTGAAQSGGNVTDIHKVDFLNFTYQTSLCSREYGRQGIGKTVRLSDGEFKSKNAYVSVTQDVIVYGDVTGDGQDDAVVPVDCGAVGANFSRSEIQIYTIKGGRAVRLATLSDKDLERAYRGFYPDTETYWGVAGGAPKISNGNLDIDVLADGSHAAPKYSATLGYHLTGTSLRPVGKPERRETSQ